MKACNGRRSNYAILFFVIVVLVATTILPTYREFSAVSTVALKEQTSIVTNSSISTDDKRKKEHNNDFYYDRERWSSAKIAVLVGPHKTASSTLQGFLVGLTAQEISVHDNDTNSTYKYPNDEWVWPVGIKSEYSDEFNGINAVKFYAALGSCLFGRHTDHFFPKWKHQTKEEIQEARVWILEYFRSLFARVWNDGMNLVIGSEHFDTLVMSLAKNDNRTSHYNGEETHVAPDSSNKIAHFLDLLPWSSNANLNAASRNLRLKDIEIQINFRTPRINHEVSIWHQLGEGETLKDFMVNKTELMFYLNSLALALQFVRKGIKTTIIDMQGVKEKESNKNSTTISSKNSTEETIIIGGLQGVVACDILRMGNDREGTDVFCDDNSTLHISNYDVPVRDLNKRKDKAERELSEKQMEDINRVYEEYDCSVWKHLKKYQEKGLLRILYPSEHLFETCDPSSPDISFYDTTLRARTIASRNKDWAQ